MEADVMWETLGVVEKREIIFQTHNNNNNKKQTIIIYCIFNADVLLILSKVLTFLRGGYLCLNYSEHLESEIISQEEIITKYNVNKGVKG